MSKLQTGSASKGEKLSKDEQTSDRFGIKRRKAVKRRREFGQGSKGEYLSVYNYMHKNIINPNSAPNKNLPESNTNPGRSITTVY
jgi:hypothetical protein